MVHRVNRALGKRDSAGRERANTSVIADRIMSRTGIAKSDAGDAGGCHERRWIVIGVTGSGTQTATGGTAC